MANNYVAKLDSECLPEWFSYAPLIPRKRISVATTYNSQIVQMPTSNVYVENEGTIPWTCDGCSATEFATFMTKYTNLSTAAAQEMLFEGYWGDSYNVIFSQFDQPQPRSRLFDLSGMFIVLETIALPAPVCSVTNNTGSCA